MLGDLESFGLLELRPDSGFPAVDLLGAMAVELSFSPWADEMILTLWVVASACQRRSVSTMCNKPMTVTHCSTGLSSVLPRNVSITGTRC